MQKINTFVILVFGEHAPREKTFMKMFEQDIDFGTGVSIYIGKVTGRIRTLEWVSEQSGGPLQKKYRGVIENNPYLPLEEVQKELESHGWT